MGLRGTKFTQPPIYIFPDMDWQAKYKAQKENHFFADKRDDRPAVPGSIPRGQGWERVRVFSESFEYLPSLDPVLYSGKDDAGAFVRGFPVPVTHEFMARGQQKYTVFCSACHGALGDGNGITKQYGMIATPSYMDARLRDMAEGEIFNTITNGKNTMNGYGDKLSPEDRWAVIAYVRALQRARNSKVTDVPAAYQSTLAAN